jgi:hypothetical protein
MIKQLIPRVGRMKICLIENDEIKSQDLNNNIVNIEREKIFDSRLYFLESLQMILLQFNGREFELYFGANEEGETEVNPHFLSPRLKIQPNEHFLLSGLFIAEAKLWLAVGKFGGNISDNYPHHEDDVDYGLNYWNN